MFRDLPRIREAALTTSQQFGGTLGLASMTAMAAAVSATAGRETDVATAQGYAAAFGMGAVLAVIGAAASATFRWKAPRPAETVQ